MEKRGSRNLRETSKEIGVSASTLMRIEKGYVPDIKTFGKICNWLGIDPAEYLGIETKIAEPTQTSTFSVHLRADKDPDPKTINALAEMILQATKLYSNK